MSDKALIDYILETWPKVVKALKNADQLKDEFSMQNTTPVLAPFALDLYERFKDSRVVIFNEIGFKTFGSLELRRNMLTIFFPYAIWWLEVFYGRNFLKEFKRKLRETPGAKKDLDKFFHIYIEYYRSIIPKLTKIDLLVLNACSRWKGTTEMVLEIKNLFKLLVVEDVSISKKTVRERYHRLIKLGVLFHTSIVDLNKIGLRQVVIELSPPRVVEDFQEFLRMFLVTKGQLGTIPPRWFCVIYQPKDVPIPKNGWEVRAEMQSNNSSSFNGTSWVDPIGSSLITPTKKFSQSSLYFDFNPLQDQINLQYPAEHRLLDELCFERTSYIEDFAKNIGKSPPWIQERFRNWLAVGLIKKKIRVQHVGLNLPYVLYLREGSSKGSLKEAIRRISYLPSVTTFIGEQTLLSRFMLPEGHLNKLSYSLQSLQEELDFQEMVLGIRDFKPYRPIRFVDLWDSKNSKWKSPHV